MTLTRQARKIHPERREARVTDASHPSRITRRAILKEIYATCEREGRIAYKRECRSPLPRGARPGAASRHARFHFLSRFGTRPFSHSWRATWKTHESLFPGLFSETAIHRVCFLPRRGGCAGCSSPLTPALFSPLPQTARAAGFSPLTSTGSHRSDTRSTPPRGSSASTTARLGPCQTPKPRLRNPSR
jgi:hypothetical protein